MLWLRRNGDFVATDKRGQYTVYRAGGRTHAASFKPHGTHAITRDIGIANSLGEAKGIAERHATTAATAYGSRTRSSRMSRFALYASRARGNYRVVIFGKGAISGFASARRAHEWARQEMHPRIRYRVEAVSPRRRRRRG